MSTEHVQVLEPSLNMKEAWNKYSQFGEDGLIDAALNRFGTHNKWCFEVGASDGRQYSNTLRLIEDGWNSVQIEADDEQFDKLKQLHFTNPNVFCVHDRVRMNSLDVILGSVGAPTDLDLGVIDIDGQDYWVWTGMRVYKPRLMLVEFARANDEVLPPISDESKVQATLGHILALGKEKGYRAIAQTYVNVLFCLEALL